MRLLTLLLSATLLLGCESADIDDYRGVNNELKLDKFFVGELDAHGMVQDISGKVTRRFVVTMQGRLEDNRIILEEDFVFDDGEKQRRVWQLEPQGGDRWLGRADDILGVAEGQLEGFALRWRYDMRLKVDGSEVDVAFDDWLYQIDENTLLNKSDINKFGLTVGQVTLVIRKR
ncbi:DUF3833 domain-containing protein [Shewanella zhangzhouensis]|uniref:DUF3833 domain-containing protein n=1 Tax=Shewanella zhangzhouensis TaxID=2864213 RepID=UPI001C65B6E6|nr:DUF3833 domain-containing protein [Shewanella zhangzhouensis]QYK06104.1 DUF3833 domain-containing protein [Shewanella zhangzhouensis]